MAQAKDTEAIYAEIPPSLKFLVDEDEKPNKEVLIEALEQYFGVSKDESEAVIRRKIKRKEQRFEAVNDQLEETRATRSNLKDEIERLREILESKEDDREEYQNDLDDVLDSLEDGYRDHVFPEHGAVTEIAAEFDRTPDEVLYDLKQRAVEQSRDLQNTHFMDTYGHKVEPKPIAESFTGGDADE